MFKQIFLITAVAVGLASCHTKSKDNAPHYQIPFRGFLDMMNVQPGSVFIYRDSMTGKLDTLDEVGCSHSDVYNEEQETWYEGAGFSAHGKDFEGYGFRIGGSKYSMDVVSGDWSNVKVSDNGFWAAKEPLQVGQSESDSYRTVRYINYYSTYIVYGKAYNKVYEIETNAGGKTVHMFFSAESELIKYTLSYPSVFESWSIVSASIKH